MSGPPPAGDADRVRTADPKKAVLDVQVVPALAGDGPPPEPPPNLPAEVLADWHAFWCDPLAKGIATSELPALRRLFNLRGVQLRLLQRADRDELFELGSTEQLVVHPGIAAAMAMEPKITALEDRFALTLKARQNTGIRMGQLAEAAEKVAKAQAALSKETTPRADPRFAAGPAAAGQQPGS